MKMMAWKLPAFVLLALAVAGATWAADDANAVAALDTEYQAAVEKNDWKTMDRILHPDFVLVLGNGKTISRAELIASARDQEVIYEKQVEDPGTQKVRMFGKDTATVTACLWIKYSGADHAVRDYKVWFTDTYVRTQGAWRYALGMASLHMP